MVSVIVPVYNAAQTLPRCLESIRQQSCSDFEVILINDGSTDNSLSICQYYAQSDPRFHVFSQPNGGEAVARNVGMSHVSTPFFCFVDADDYVDASYIAHLLEDASPDVDLVVHGNRRHRGDAVRTQRFTQHQEFFFEQGQASECFEAFDVVEFGMVWSKLFRTELVRAHRLQFFRDIKLAVDQCFLVDYLCVARSVVLSPHADYHFVANSSSLSTCYWTYLVERSGYLRLSASWERLLSRFSVPGLKASHSAFVGHYVNRLVVSVLLHPAERNLQDSHRKELEERFLPQLRSFHCPTTLYTRLLRLSAINHCYHFYTLLFRLAVKRYHLPVNYV